MVARHGNLGGSLSKIVSSAPTWKWRTAESRHVDRDDSIDDHDYDNSNSYSPNYAFMGFDLFDHHLETSFGIQTIIGKWVLGTELLEE